MIISVVDINYDSSYLYSFISLLSLHSFLSDSILAGFVVPHLEFYGTKFPESSVQTPIM